MIRKLALALALWLAPLPALAALAIDSQEAANTGHSSATSPISWSFTNTAGTLLIVGACVNNSNTGTPTISSVTYNGVAMTAISGTSNSVVIGTDTTICSQYQLLNPATGAHTVSVSYAGNCGGCVQDAIAGAISFSGNNTTTPTGNPATATDTTGTSTAATVAVTGTTSGDFVVSLLATGTAVGAASAPTVVSWKDNVSSGFIGDAAALGQQTTSGGTVNAGFAVSADVWLMSAIEVFKAPAGGGPSPTNGLELVSVGGTLNHGDGSPGGGGALAPGFFVSSTGNDNNAGTLASPWLTIFHAQQVMRGNNCGGVPTGLCLTYVRGGTYNIGSTIGFTSADKGETVQYYPPDGVDTAALDGGGNGTGVSPLINGDGVANLTLNGLKLRNFGAFGIRLYTSPGSVIENMDVGFGGITGSGVGSSAGITIGDHTTVNNNYVHDMAGGGITTFAFNPGDSYEGASITANVVLNTCLQLPDCGAIYGNARSTNVNGGHVSVTSNYVRDYGNSGVQAEAMYLDDDASNFTITGNIFGPPSANLASGVINELELNGGAANTVTGNIFDLNRSNVALTAEGPGGTGGSLSFGSPPSPNVIRGNIIITSYAGSSTITNFDENGLPFDENPASSAAWLTISNNAYHNYGGGTEPTGGNLFGDSSPQAYTPTQLGLLSCVGGIYAVSGGSTVTGAPVSFPALPTSWGPPGFTIPASTNHSC